jgi:hypothetical protein
MAPKAPDPANFELVTALQRSTKRAWLVAVLMAGTAFLAVFAVFLQASKPIPVIFRPDNVEDPSQVIYTGGSKDVPTREIDAKRFFMRTGVLLHGWSSATVVKDLTAASQLMTTKWRKLFGDELNRVIDVPPEVSPNGKETQLGYYAGIRVRNNLDWQWNSITCERNESQRSWGCYGRVTVETQPLIGDPLTSPPRKSLIIRATFTEVPVTLHTIDGLLVDFWDQRDADAKPVDGKPADPGR